MAVWSIVTIGLYVMSVVFAPVHRTLAGRFVFVSVILALTASMSYSVTYSGPVPRLFLITACVACVCVIASTRGKAEARLPKLGWGEAAAGVFTVVTAWWFLPLVRLGTAEEVVARLGRRPDQAAHFSLIEFIRTNNAIPAVLPDSVAMTSRLSHYPAGYHSIVASVMELSQGRVTSIEIDPVQYAHSYSLVVGLTIVVLMAAIASHEPIRKSRVLTFSALAMMGAFWFGSRMGAGLSAHGWGNFIIASCAATIAMMTLTRMAVAFSRRDAVILAACLTLTVDTWPVLAVAPWVGALVLLTKLSFSRERRDGRLSALATACLGAVVLSARTVLRMSHAPRDFEVPFYLVGGAITHDPPWVSIALVCLALGITFASSPTGATSPVLKILDPVVSQIIVMAIVLAFVGWQQLQILGSLQYYWFKPATFAALLSLVGVLLATSRPGVGLLLKLVALGAALTILASGVVAQGPGLYARGAWSEFPSEAQRLAAARALVGAQQLSQQQGRIAYLDDAVLTEQGLSDDELDQRIAYARWALALAGKDARGDHDVPSDAYYSSGSIEERARLVAQRHPSVTVLIKPGPWADALEAAGVRVTRLA